MRDATTILLRPVVSEKSYGLMEEGVYVFEIDPQATKVEVRQAVEQIFHVSVTKVNTLNRKGKSVRNRRTGRIGGHRPDSKRAIVTLKKGDTINLFEN
jgi:large subunit ribosomal protein L23